MEKVAEWIISTKRNIADWYLQRLQQIEKVAEEIKFRRAAKWLQKKTQQVGKCSGTKLFKSIWQKGAKRLQDVENVAEWIRSTVEHLLNLQILIIKKNNKNNKIIKAIT